MGVWESSSQCSRLTDITLRHQGIWGTPRTLYSRKAGQYGGTERWQNFSQVWPSKQWLGHTNLGSDAGYLGELGLMTVATSQRGRLIEEKLGSHPSPA